MRTEIYDNCTYPVGHPVYCSCEPWPFVVNVPVRVSPTKHQKPIISTDVCMARILTLSSESLFPPRTRAYNIMSLRRADFITSDDNIKTLYERTL